MEHVKNTKNVILNVKMIPMGYISLNVQVFFALPINLSLKWTYLIRIVCITMLTDLRNHRRNLKQTRTIKGYSKQILLIPHIQQRIELTNYNDLRDCDSKY